MTIAIDSMRARAAIMRRLRADTGSTGTPPELPPVDGWRRRPAVASDERLIDAFRRNATGWRAEVADARPDDWPRRVAGLLRDNDLTPAIAGHGSRVGQAVSACLTPDELDCPDDDLAQLKPALFDRYRAGVVGTVGGIAETGSLILWPDRGEPRSLSLVPPVCLAVLFASRLFPDFDAAMRQLDWATSMPSNALLVTGPSKTADIQRMLVYGAHGPRRLLIVLVDDSGEPA